MTNTDRNCGRCKTTQELESYTKDKNGPGGFSRWCKACQSNYRNSRKIPCPDCKTEMINPFSSACHPCHQKKLVGPNNPSYKGGRTINKGYVMLSGYQWHLNSYPNGQIREHMLVMSLHIGRALRDGEEVHHKNGQKEDNRIENLELWSKSHPAGQRAIDKYNWALEIIELYGPIFADQNNQHES